MLGKTFISVTVRELVESPYPLQKGNLELSCHLRMNLPENFSLCEKLNVWGILQLDH